MIGGYVGRILRANLSTGKVSQESIRTDYMEKFIGGRGLAAKMLFDEIPARTDPLSRENKLILMTGPLTGTSVPTSSRFVAATKSPETRIYAYSIAGGAFGPALKQSGYDGVIIEGESLEPKLLFIDDGEAVLKDASWLWGTPVFEASRLIKGAIGQDVKIALIGPAGEKLVRFAAIITDDRRALGRCGFGTVLGAKKLKAIAVKGRAKPSIAHMEKFSPALRLLRENIRIQPGPWKEFPETGTQSGPRKNDAWGILPTKNWQETVFEGAAELSHPNLRERFVIKDTGCPGCPVRCTKITSVRSGLYAGALTEGPEYETLYAFGSNCGIRSPEAVIAADMMCDNFGLDTISTGVTIAWAMECFERGLLTTEEMDGLELRFGKDEAMIKAVKKIAYREGKFGELAAEGTRAASSKIGKGTEKYAMQVKGLEMGGYDPRGCRGMALVFACGPRGGCHHAYGVSAFIEIPEGTAFQSEGKGEMVHGTARTRILLDSSPLCNFISAEAPLELVTKLISSVTGIDMTLERLKENADRIATVERAFNAREGLTRKDDLLPERLVTEHLPSGPNRGQVVTTDELELMKSEFYKAMKWDPNTGLPTRARLQTLGLEDIADKLAAAGILFKQ